MAKNRDYINWPLEKSRNILTNYYKKLRDKGEFTTEEFVEAQCALVSVRNRFGGLSGYVNDGQITQAGMQILYDCGSPFIELRMGKLEYKKLN